MVGLPVHLRKKVIPVEVLSLYKATRLYPLAQSFRNDVAALEAYTHAPPDLARLSTIGPLLTTTNRDARALRDEVAVLLPLTRWLSDLPGYGPDVAAIGPLLDIAVDLSGAADDSVSVITPLLSAPQPGLVAGMALSERLALAQPRLISARQSLDRVIATQGQLAIDKLSPAIRDRLTRLTPLIRGARDGLTLALLAPKLLGADRPRSYLLMALNQDELRAGGGFITAAGVITLDRGQRAAFTMHNSPEIDDRKAHRYPPPPEPMRRYMDIPQWVFRDANWSPNFPTSAAQAMYFYKLGQGRDVDGVITFDQLALQQLLGAVGPVSVTGIAEPVSAENIIAYLRDTRSDGADQVWQKRKGAFMSSIAAPLLAKIERDPTSLNVPLILRMLRRMLDERHIQLFVTDAEGEFLLAQYGWDGAVRPGLGDFLMVVDSNIGYNKVNPNIRQQITYDLNLSEPGLPRAIATITYTHQISSPYGCPARAPTVGEPSYGVLMSRCYVDFLRVLIPSGSRIEHTSTEPTPGAWLLSGMDDDGSVTVGQGEATTWELSTLLVVPIGGSRTVSFAYQLPDMLTRDGDIWRYALKLQKQAGTAAIPFVVRVHLPAGATLVDQSPTLINKSGQLLLAGQLSQDQSISLSFRVP